MPKFIVTSPGGRTITVEAKNSTQAKRKACKIWELKPTDYWCGITSLKARKI